MMFYVNKVTSLECIPELCVGSLWAIYDNEPARKTVPQEQFIADMMEI
jgi:hypothetical protein